MFKTGLYHTKKDISNPSNQSTTINYKPKSMHILLKIKTPLQIPRTSTSALC